MIQLFYQINFLPEACIHAGNFWQVSKMSGPFFDYISSSSTSGISSLLNKERSLYFEKKSGIR